MYPGGRDSSLPGGWGGGRRDSTHSLSSSGHSTPCNPRKMLDIMKINPSLLRYINSRPLHAVAQNIQIKGNFLNLM